MQGFGKRQETVDFVNTLLLGKSKFNIIAVNPSLTQLKQIKDSGINVFVPEKEPEYIGKASIKFGGTDQTPYFDVRFYLRNTDDPTIISQISYRVFNAKDESKDGSKFRVINPYGQTAWLPKVEIDAKVAATAPAFFISTDTFRYAFKGEENLIKFLRAFLNMPVVANPTADASGKMRKAIDVDKRKDYLTSFDIPAIQEMIAGKFTGLQSLVANNLDGTIGLLCGVRTTTGDDNKTKRYQAFYADEPLRPYAVEKSNGDAYLLKNLNEAIDNGRFGNIYWGSHNLVSRIFDEKEMPNAAPASSNPFGDTNAPASGFGAAVSDNPFSTPPASQDAPEDDLPF